MDSGVRAATAGHLDRFPAQTGQDLFEDILDGRKAGLPLESRIGRPVIGHGKFQGTHDCHL